MALNTATFGGYTQTERSKMRHELGAYFKDHPEAYSDIPEAWLERYNEDQSDYLSASSEERREDFTGRPSQVDYIADYVLANSADPGVAQIVGSLPDIGEVAVGEQTADTKVYHGPTSLLGKIGMGIGAAGMIAGGAMAGAGLLNAAGIGSGFGGLATGGGGAATGGTAGTGATTFGASIPGYTSASPAFAPLASPGGMTAGTLAGSGGSGLLAPITASELSLAAPGLAEATSAAIAPTFSSGITAGGGLVGVPTAGGLSTGMGAAISSAVNPAAAMTALTGAGVAPYVPITASNLTLAPPGIGEASAGLVDSIALGNGTTVGSAVGNMAGTFPAVSTAGGTTAGLSGTIDGLINTAATGNEFGLPGLIGDQLANPVYDNLINNIQNPPVENYVPVEEKSVEAGTGWAEGAPAAGTGLSIVLNPRDILTAGTLLAGAIGGDGGGSGNTGEPFQFTPFDSTPVNAPDTQMVFPQGGYYQQQANAMVPGGGQQMPTPEQYQGLLNSAFSRRV